MGQPLLLASRCEISNSIPEELPITKAIRCRLVFIILITQSIFSQQLFSGCDNHCN